MSRPLQSQTQGGFLRLNAHLRRQYVIFEASYSILGISLTLHEKLSVYYQCPHNQMIHNRTPQKLTVKKTNLFGNGRFKAQVRTRPFYLLQSQFHAIGQRNELYVWRSAIASMFYLP